MTPPGVGWRCSNRSMSGMALAVTAEGNRSADHGDTVRLLEWSGLTGRRTPTAAATIALEEMTLTIGLKMHGVSVHDLAMTTAVVMDALLAADPMVMTWMPCTSVGAAALPPTTATRRMASGSARTTVAASLLGDPYNGAEGPLWHA